MRINKPKINLANLDKAGGWKNLPAEIHILAIKSDSTLWACSNTDGKILVSTGTTVIVDPGFKLDI